MMIFANTAIGPTSAGVTATTDSRPEVIFSATFSGDTPPELVREANFKQRAIPMDLNGQFLRLWDDTSLRLNLFQQEFEVEGWGIRMKMSEAIDLPREMARQFLRLWGQSERGQLQGNDLECWEQIADLVDFQTFCNDRAEYRYVEGELIQRTREGARVKWPNGTIELLSFPLGRALDLVDIGELFSASAKINSSGRVREIENCTILGVAEDLLQKVNDDWIQKA